MIDHASGLHRRFQIYKISDRLPVKMPTEKIAFCDTYTIPHEEAFTQDLQYPQVNSSTTGTYEDVDENALVVMSSLISPVGSTR